MKSINQSSINPEYLRDVYAKGNSIGTELGQAGLESGIRHRNNRDTINISEEVRRLQRTSQALNADKSSFDQQKEINRPGQQKTVLRVQVNLEKQNLQSRQEERTQLNKNDEFQKWLEGSRQLHEDKNDPDRIEIPRAAEPKKTAENEKLSNKEGDK